MTQTKVKQGDCSPPPPSSHLPPPPPLHPHHTMATHQLPLYQQHRLRLLQQQATTEDAGTEMANTGGRSYKGPAAAAAAAAASLLTHHRPTWHIKDEVLPQIHSQQHDVFEEWLNGYVQRTYSVSCPDAKGHQSGWAMRNTNNHDPKRLKKSCLGVMMCSRKCVNDDGFMVHIRPYICDKARRKQEGIRCPTKGCEGHLFQVKCNGHAGKPVTHIWRTEANTIFFQAKGEHGHLAPEPKMSVNARRSVEAKNNRPTIHNGTMVRRNWKTSGRKTIRSKQNSTQMKPFWRPRDMTSMSCDVFPPHPLNIFALPQQQHPPHQATSASSSSFRTSIISPLFSGSSTSHLLPLTTTDAQFIEMDDLPAFHPHHHPLSQSNWPPEHEMAPPPAQRPSCPSSMIDGSSPFFHDVCASMSFSPGPPTAAAGGATLLPDTSPPPPPCLKDYAMVHGLHPHQQPHLPFCIPSSQGSTPFYSNGYFRSCPSGGGSPDSEGDESIDDDGRLEVAAALGLIGGGQGSAVGIDGYLLSEMGQAARGQYQATSWLSCDMLSPLDQSSTPSTLSYHYPSSFQCHRNNQLQLEETKTSSILHRSFHHQQQQPHQSPHLSHPSFDMMHHRHQTFAGIAVGLSASSSSASSSSSPATAAAAAAVYFAGSNNDYLPNSAIVRT